MTGDAKKETDVLIPIDPTKRSELYDLACLTDEERHALDVWCYEQARLRAKGILLSDSENYA